MGNLYELRGQELPLELLFKLAPFVDAYRPHDEIPTTKELKGEGYTRIYKETFVDEWEEQYFDNHGYYPWDDPDLEKESQRESKPTKNKLPQRKLGPLKRLHQKPTIPVAGNDQSSQRDPETKYTSFQPSHSKGFGLVHLNYRRVKGVKVE